jgi:nicotinamide-nucleotide amidase
VAVVLAEETGRLLKSRGLTIATAESCTGGKLGDMITEVPGSSDYFLGGIVSYSNQAKLELLGVDKGILDSKGAVSEEVALQMAEGARRKLHADIGVGITGIAGPTGGTVTKPIGLVYIAVSSEKKAVCTRNLFSDSRSDVKTRSAEKALEMVNEFLIKD